jgi:hypothetical protein
VIVIVVNLQFCLQWAADVLFPYCIKISYFCRFALNISCFCGFLVVVIMQEDMQLLDVLGRH